MYTYSTRILKNDEAKQTKIMVLLGGTYLAQTNHGTGQVDTHYFYNGKYYKIMEWEQHLDIIEEIEYEENDI